MYEYSDICGSCGWCASADVSAWPTLIPDYVKFIVAMVIVMAKKLIYLKYFCLFGDYLSVTQKVSLSLS